MGARRARRRRAGARGLGLIALLLCAACSGNDGAQTSSVSSGGTAALSGDAAQTSAVTPPINDAATAVTMDAAVSADASVSTMADVVVVEAAAPEPVGFPTVPIHVRPIAGATGADAQIDLELRADGTILWRTAPFATFAAGRVVDRSQTELVRVAADRVVIIGGRRTALRIMEDGALRSQSRTLLRFEDDGSVREMNGETLVRTLPLRVEGVRRETRGTAALLSIVVGLAH